VPKICLHCKSIVEQGAAACYCCSRSTTELPAEPPPYPRFVGPTRWTLSGEALAYEPADSRFGIHLTGGVCSNCGLICPIYQPTCRNCGGAVGHDPTRLPPAPYSSMSNARHAFAIALRYGLAFAGLTLLAVAAWYVDSAGIGTM